jgi:NADPH:quinone reductase-like Zn-dependent oxidoreductase
MNGQASHGRASGPRGSKITSEDLGALGELLEAGKVKPIIDRTYRLSDAVEALGYLGERHARAKVVIAVSP